MSDTEKEVPISVAAFMLICSGFATAGSVAFAVASVSPEHRWWAGVPTVTSAAIGFVLGWHLVVRGIRWEQAGHTRRDRRPNSIVAGVGSVAGVSAASVLAGSVGYWLLSAGFFGLLAGMATRSLPVLIRKRRSTRAEERE